MNTVVICLIILLAIMIGIAVYFSVLYFGVDVKYAKAILTIGRKNEDIEYWKHKCEKLEAGIDIPIKIEYRDLHPVTISGIKVVEDADFRWVEDKSSIDSIIMNEIVEDLSSELHNYITLEKTYNDIFDRTEYRYSISLILKEE